jgi:hypothetical protein
MRHLVRPRAKCTTCRQDYDEAGGEAAAHHREPVDCGESCRCDGRPRCYTCGGSFRACSSALTRSYRPPEHPTAGRYQLGAARLLFVGFRRVWG